MNIYQLLIPGDSVISPLDSNLLKKKNLIKLFLIERLLKSVVMKLQHLNKKKEFNHLITVFFGKSNKNLAGCPPPPPTESAL